MDAAHIGPSLSRFGLRPARRRWQALSSDTRFRIGVAGATLVHLLAIFGAMHAVPRQMGETDGNPDGVSVVIVDAADLRSRDSVPLDAQPQSQQSAQPQQPMRPQQPQQQQAEPQQQQQAEPAQAQPESQAVPLRKTTKADPQPKQDQPDRTAEQPALQPTLPNLFELPDLPSEGKTQQPQKRQPEREKAETAPRQTSQTAPQKQARNASPGFAMPDVAMNYGGSSASATRPPGITRSGENDEFGRNVIRALARVMPRINVLGRVQVRIFLNTKGNVADVQVVRPSTDPFLDQNVVFSVRQANFPIPPDNSTDIDRTFLVTYIYH